MRRIYGGGGVRLAVSQGDAVVGEKCDGPGS